VDAIRDDDVDRARRTSPGEKVSQALEMMRLGIELKRATFTRLHPGSSAEQIEAMVQAWLEADD